MHEALVDDAYRLRKMRDGLRAIEKAGGASADRLRELACETLRADDRRRGGRHWNPAHGMEP